MTAVSRLLGALALVAAPLAAQAPGLPVHGGGFRRGLEVVATLGWPGASSFTGKATTYGGTLAYGWSRLGLAGTVAGVDVQGASTVLSLGALASLRAFGNGVDTPFEVSLFGGYGHYDSGSSSGDWRAPFGAALVVAITTPVVSIRPWIAPRGELYSLPTGSTESTTTKLAGSAGVDFRFPGGLGIRALWDKVEDQDQTLGVGLSWRF